MGVSINSGGSGLEELYGGCSYALWGWGGVLFVGVLMLTALQFLGDTLGASDCWKFSPQYTKDSQTVPYSGL